MFEYILAADNLLSEIWGQAEEQKIKTLLAERFGDWAEEEQQDLLELCAALALYESRGARDVTDEAERRGLEIQDAARITSKQLARLRTVNI
ncbi:hypothetical protein ACRBEV_32985 (plasmid) [Methylobacterium phyllosphaerae]